VIQETNGNQVQIAYQAGAGSGATYLRRRGRAHD
jgi:hypothetical protein